MLLGSLVRNTFLFVIVVMAIFAAPGAQSGNELPPNC